MQLVKGMVVVGLAVSFCMAQALSISGTVIDSLTNAPIFKATVQLERSGLSTFTDASGAFLFGAPAAIRDFGPQAAASSVPVMSAQGEIRLSLQEAARVTVKTYSIGGKQIGSMETTLGAGNHSIVPAKRNSGVYLYQVVVNGKAYTLQQANVEGRAYTQVNATGRAIPFQGLAKSAGFAALFPDHLTVSAGGYATQSRDLTDSVATGIVFKMRTNDQDCPLVTGASTTDGGDTIAGNRNSSYTFDQSLYVCRYNYWYVVANIPYNSADKSIRSFPKVQVDCDPALQLSSLQDLTIDFSEVCMHTSNKMMYTACTDMWVNGVGIAAGSTDIEIWNDVWYITPPGAKQTTAAPDTIDGKAYNVYIVTDANQKVTAVTFVSVTAFYWTQNSMNLLAFGTYLTNRSWIATTSTISQISYGFKIVSTNGAPSTFLCNNFAVIYD